MSATIAVTGKGGVGKTTISSLIIQWLVAAGKTPVLAVDADSNANLNEALGIDYQATVGGIREDARKVAKELAGIAKQEFLDLRVQEALVEEAGYDLIVMGRPEGPGCYCYANNVLRDVIQRLADNYQHIVIDNEAGLEHLSRRTVLAVDYLIIVSDCSVRGVRTAGRIAELAQEMGTPVKERGLIVNRVPGGILPAGVQAEVEATGLPLLAAIPHDASVAEMDGGGFAVAAIPADAPARVAINELLTRLMSREPVGS
ncbi:MAG TPA: AAA family ATPase [Armatimonadota bacterium]|jgi:CO dehydrogenase maturation factor